MYGRYTKDLGEYAKDEARRLRLLERRRKKDDKARNKVIYVSYAVKTSHQTHHVLIVCRVSIRHFISIITKRNSSKGWLQQIDGIAYPSL